MIDFPNHTFSFDPGAQNLADVPLTHFLTNDETPPAKSQIYLMKDMPPPAQLTGSTNLLAQFGLEATYNKFCGKKVKESLSSFLPDIPGVIDISEAGNSSTLRSLIDKPPIVGSKEILPLPTATLMSAFRLHPGPLPDQYRPVHQSESRRKHKHHKSKNRPDVSFRDTRTPEMDEIKKHKKRKHEDGEKKKKKKDKKRKNKEKKIISSSERSFTGGGF